MIALGMHSKYWETIPKHLSHSSELLKYAVKKLLGKTIQAQLPVIITLGMHKKHQETIPHIYIYIRPFTSATPRGNKTFVTALFLSAF